jgi:hypothetical protein
MKVPERKEGELLVEWSNRLATAYHFTPEQREVLNTVRIESYIAGVNAAESANNHK